MSDVRYALRNLARNPGFAAVAVLTLGLGIGANTVMFTIFNGVLLRPLDFRQPDRLFAVQESLPVLAKIASQLPVNALHFGEWRRNSRSFEGLAMVGGAVFNLTSDGDPLRVPGARVSSSVFSVLGLTPQIGRVFTNDEDQPGRDQVVLLSDGLWTSRFQRDRAIVGRKILLDGIPYEVIGVLPARPKIPMGAELVSLPGAATNGQIWKPFAVRPEEMSTSGDYNYGCIARLKPGVTPAQAAADLDAIEAAIQQRYGQKDELRVSLTPLHEQMTGSSRQSLVLLLTAVGAVLLIVCVNIASLMLIRVNARQREIAIRAAIGASAARLVRQVLAEALAIAALGGVLGIVFAYSLVGVVIRNLPAALPRVDDVRLDGTVLAFTVLVALATGLLFGLLPAWRFARANPGDALKGSGRAGTEGRHGGQMRNLLVSIEVALSAVTLVAAGLLLNSFVRLMNVDKGFQADRVMTANVRFPENRYPMPKRTEFVHTLLERVQALPGVAAAGVSNMLPLAGEGSNSAVILEGQPSTVNERPVVDFRSVSPDYFRAMGIPLLSGRIFDEQDRNRQVVLVSARATERLWPGEDPRGKRFHLGGPMRPLLEVVGVVGDIHGVSLQKTPNLTVCLPYWQRDRLDMALVVRTAAMDPLMLAAEIRRKIRGLDAQLAVPEFRTMQQLVDRSVAVRRFQMDLVLMFGGSALLLAALGVYGVVSYSVNQRTKEMGIRMVLGAQRRDLRLLVVRHGLGPVLGGLGAGLATALMLGRLLGAFLFGVRADDPLTFSAVAGVVITATAAGCWLPARRATRVDPAVALRYE